MVLIGCWRCILAVCLRNNVDTTAKFWKFLTHRSGETKKRNLWSRRTLVKRENEGIKEVSNIKDNIISDTQRRWKLEKRKKYRIMKRENKVSSYAIVTVWKMKRERLRFDATGEVKTRELPMEEKINIRRNFNHRLSVFWLFRYFITKVSCWLYTTIIKAFALSEKHGVEFIFQAGNLEF